MTTSYLFFPLADLFHLTGAILFTVLLESWWSDYCDRRQRAKARKK